MLARVRHWFLLGGWMVLSVAGASSSSHADEGMYLFNDVPRKWLKETHSFEPTQTWLDHLQLSSVRFNSGGSGSFVSSNGLVLTNHHVASETLAKLSTKERNLIEDGFLAGSFAEELKAPDLELNQLISIEDVTNQINDQVTSPNDVEESAKQRRAAIAKIEEQSTEETGLRSDVVTLFGGAKYHLYRYKKYTDVRLVWAPETAAAFFGGDADNFEYPRYNLDATLMRVYENNEPAKLENFLQWNDQPATSGDLVFVSGHPGRTQRIFTVEALEFLRDQRLPHVLNLLRRKEVLLQQYRLEGKEAARRGRDELFGIQNARKAYSGMLAGLQDPQTFDAKRGRQDRILSALADDPKAVAMANAWDDVAGIQKEKAELLDRSVSLRSELFQLALQIHLLAEEDRKPNEERLPAYTDSGRESLLAQLLSPAPLYDDLEMVKLADEIALLVEQRGVDDEIVREILLGRSPKQVASELVTGTKIDEVEARQALIEGGWSITLASDDPMMRLARVIAPEYRRLDEINEQLSEREKQAYATIMQATTAIEGTGGYPDATFTLRLAFGTVSGYEERGEQVDPTTNFGGAFEHAIEHEGQDDFDLPESWMSAKEQIDLSTQLNFVCTADIIGGNSGSPVVDRDGKLVGLIFDGNIQSLTSDYLYTDVQGRAVSVSGVAIPEALRSIYNASELADQLGR